MRGDFAAMLMVQSTVEWSLEVLEFWALVVPFGQALRDGLASWSVPPGSRLGGVAVLGGFFSGLPSALLGGWALGGPPVRSAEGP